MNNEQKLELIKRYFTDQECNFECELKQILSGYSGNVRSINVMLFTKYDSHISDYMKVNNVFRDYFPDKKKLAVEFDELYNCLLPELRKLKIDKMLSEY